MNESMQKTLFIHQNMESPFYYLSGTAVLIAAILGLIGIVAFSVYKNVKAHRNIDYLPKEIYELGTGNIIEYLLLVLSSFFVFVISISLFPQALVEGWAEDIGMLIFFPFFAALVLGHRKRFWKVYFFSLVYLSLRVVFLGKIY